MVEAQGARMPINPSEGLKLGAGRGVGAAGGARMPINPSEGLKPGYGLGLGCAKPGTNADQPVRGIETPMLMILEMSALHECRSTRPRD